MPIPPPTTETPDMPDRLLAAAALAYVGLAGTAGLLLAVACVLGGGWPGTALGAALAGLGL